MGFVWEGFTVSRETYVGLACERSVRIVASVLDGNLPSQKLFESCGYCFADGRWQKMITTHEVRWG